jgi:hypothetical protein
MFLRLGKHNYRDVIASLISKLEWWEKNGGDGVNFIEEFKKDMPSFSEIFVELFHAWLQRHRNTGYTAEQNQLLALMIAVVGPQWDSAREFSGIHENMSYDSHLRTSHSKTEANIRGRRIFDQTAAWIKVI